MTKLERETIRAIKAWCGINGDPAPGKVGHVYPRAYVLGRSASLCLLVSIPPVDTAPQIQQARVVMDADGSTVIHVFDDTLRAGDWCSVAYALQSGGGGLIAIPAVAV
jgi:hypothetical protein